MLLAECDGKKILLTGDARDDHIIDGLRNTGLAPNGKLHVDILKVQHHGSDRNATRRFFDAITADTYVICGDGSRQYGSNPDTKTLNWIVDSAYAARRQIKIVVTNTTTNTETLRRDLKPEDFGYTLETIAPGQHAIGLTLSP